jgi:hypothetical protein
MILDTNLNVYLSASQSSKSEDKHFSKFVSISIFKFEEKFFECYDKKCAEKCINSTQYRRLIENAGKHSLHRQGRSRGPYFTFTVVHESIDNDMSVQEQRVYNGGASGDGDRQDDRQMRPTSRGATSRGATSRGATSKGATSRGATSRGATSKGATSRGATSSREARSGQ